MLRPNSALCILRRLGSGLSYAHNPGDEPLSSHTVGQLLDEASRKYGHREAIVSMHQKRRLTFSELRNKSIRVAASLLHLGLKPGERVGIWSPNYEEWEVAQLASAKAGFVLVNINPAYEVLELRHCLQLVQVSALITADSFRGRNFYETLLRAAPDLKLRDDGKVESKDLPSLRQLITIGTQLPKGHMNFDVLLETDFDSAENSLQEVEKNIETHDGFNIQFTSGTTGRPKATLLSHHGTINNAFNFGKRINLADKEHRICLPNPFFHCFGCMTGVLTSLHYGVTLVLPAPAHSPPHNIRAIQEEKCTVVYGTPTMHVDLINEASRKGLTGHDLGLDTVVTGGALCPEQFFIELKNKFKVPQVSCVYGMTECSPVNFQTVQCAPLELQAATVGRLGKHWEAKVVDSHGRMVPFGEPGELWVRGYGNMLSYWADPEATAATITPDGWLKTGDQFAMDKEGNGRIVGRMKDMIIRGGENIYPREIEDFLYTHPDVMEAHVYGAPDDRLGEVVCVSVVPRPNRPLTPDQLTEFCRGKMAHYKIPRYIEIVQDFPKTTSGKIQKFKLREMMIKKLQDQTTK